MYVYIYIYIYVYIYSNLETYHGAQASCVKGSNNHFNNLHFIISRETNEITACAAEQSLMSCAFSTPRLLNRRVCKQQNGPVRCGHFPKFYRVFGVETLAHWNPTSCRTKHPQLICSDLRLSNWKFEDWNYGNRQMPEWMPQKKMTAVIRNPIPANSHAHQE